MLAMVKVVDSLHVDLQPEAGRMPYEKEKGHFSTQSVNCSGHVANIASNIAEDAFSVASQHSIGLIDIK